MGKSRRAKWISRASWPIERFINLRGTWAIRKMLIATGRISPNLASKSPSVDLEKRG